MTGTWLLSFSTNALRGSGTCSARQPLRGELGCILHPGCPALDRREITAVLCKTEADRSWFGADLLTSLSATFTHPSSLQFLKGLVPFSCLPPVSSSCPPHFPYIGFSSRASNFRMIPIKSDMVWPGKSLILQPLISCSSDMGKYNAIKFQLQMALVCVRSILPSYLMTNLIYSHTCFKLFYCTQYHQWCPKTKRTKGNKTFL